MIRGILSLGTSTLVGMALGFLSLTIAVRVVSQSSFGAYSFILAIEYTLETLSSFGLQLSAARFVAGAADDGERREIVSNLLCVKLIIMVPIVLLALLCRPLLLHLFSASLQPALYIFAPLLYCVQSLDGALSYIMQGFQLYRKMALVQSLTALLGLILTLVFLLLLKLQVAGILLASILPLGISVVMRLIMIPVPKRLALDPTLARKIVTFGLPLQGNDLLTFAFDKLDVLILGALIGPTSIAYLDVAGRLPNYLRNFYQALQSVYFPRMTELFAQGRSEAAKEVLDNVLRLTAFFAMLCALLFTVFRRELITLVFSNKYLPSASGIGLLMVAVGVGLTSQLIDTALIAKGKPAYLLIINVVTAVVSVVANIRLIPIFGFMGAVTARITANVLSNPVSVICLAREGICVRISGLLKPVAFLVVCVAISSRFDPNSLFGKVFVVVLFLVLSVISSAITLEDWSGLVHAVLPRVWREREAVG